MIARVLPCAFVLLGSFLVAPRLASAEIPKGRLLETVACVADPQQTYALYLPTSFDPAKAFPVMLCFDPGARGRAPVERFREAAEKFGWIVAGSNNSRNGPWEANAAAIQAVVKDLTRHLPIDAKRVYAAGLSGGARVACQLGMNGLLQGVVSCSAAFSGGETPGKVPYLFFGTAGETDFNYHELRRVDRDLDERKAVHRVVIFDGGHEWLPAALAQEALAWFELQAMRAGTRAKDEAWIAQELAQRRAALPESPVTQRVRALNALARDFRDLAEIASTAEEATRLTASREYKDALKAERATEKKEQTWRDELLGAVSEGYVNSMKKPVAELREKAKAPGPERAMAVRVLQGVASACGEMSREAVRQRDFDAAAPLLEMAVLLRPERLQNHFELARTYAQLGDRKRTIAALQAAAAAGYKDMARIGEEKAFEKMRADPAFQAAVAAMK